MALELYKKVVLTRDISEENLRVGDLATLVDFIPHPQGKEPGCALEVFNAVGDTIAVVIVPQSTVKPLSADQILTARSLTTTPPNSNK